MNSFTKLTINLIFIFTLIGCHNTEKHVDSSTNKNAIVLVKYKAQKGKENDAIIELTKLIEKVKEEPHFVNIKLHFDSKDKTNIMLYEEWDNISYYNSEHMKTNHLQEFIENSKNFLTGAPEISVWNVENSFK